MHGHHKQFKETLTNHIFKFILYTHHKVKFLGKAVFISYLNTHCLSDLQKPFTIFPNESPTSYASPLNSKSSDTLGLLDGTSQSWHHLLVDFSWLCPSVLGKPLKSVKNESSGELRDTCWLGATRAASIHHAFTCESLRRLDNAAIVTGSSGIYRAITNDPQHHRNFC